MRAGLRVDELGVDPDAARAALYAALHHIAHAEFAADLPGIARLVAIGEGGIARDHAGPGQPREVRRKALGDAVDEIILRLVAAEIGERQHDDRPTRCGPRPL